MESRWEQPFVHDVRSALLKLESWERIESRAKADLINVLLTSPALSRVKRPATTKAKISRHRKSPICVLRIPIYLSFERLLQLHRDLLNLSEPSLFNHVQPLWTASRWNLILLRNTIALGYAVSQKRIIKQTNEGRIRGKHEM